MLVVSSMRIIHTPRWPPAPPLTLEWYFIRENLTLNHTCLTLPLADMNVRHLVDELARFVLHVSAFFPFMTYIRNFIQLLHWILEIHQRFCILGKIFWQFFLVFYPPVLERITNWGLTSLYKIFRSMPSHHITKQRSTFLIKASEQSWERRMTLVWRFELPC